jgi:hypothetical protein
MGKNFEQEVTERTEKFAVVGSAATAHRPGDEPRCLLLWWADAVGGDEGIGVGEVGRDAGGGDGFAAVNVGGDFEVEVEELLEEVFFAEKP